VMIRSAVATFYARKDHRTPVKAALTRVPSTSALKIAVMERWPRSGLR